MSTAHGGDRHAKPRVPRTELAWRAECLRRAGFGARVASAIAMDPDYDLHALLSLVDRGCLPELAVRILAPLEDRC